MEQLQITTKAIQQAVALLRAAGAQFKIISPNGDAFGELEVKPIKASGGRKPDHYKRGVLLDHARPFVAETGVGDIALIPFGEFDGKILYGSVCSHLSREWGAGSYTSTRNDPMKRIEVLRTK